MTDAAPKPGRLHFAASPSDVDLGDPRAVVADTTWTPGPGQRAIPLRDATARVLGASNFLASSMALLDAWADAAHLAEAMEVDGTSYWPRERLGLLRHLEQLTVWMAIVDELVAQTKPDELEVDEAVDSGLAAAAALIATREGIAYRGTERGGRGAAADGAGEVPADAAPATASSVTAEARVAKRPTLLGRIKRRIRPDEMTRRAQFVRTRVAHLGAAKTRSLAVLDAAAPQRVDTPSGPRFINAFLGPVMDRLRGSSLDPVTIELPTLHRDDAGWARLNAKGADRVLPGDVLRLYTDPDDVPGVDAQVAEVLARVVAIDVPALVNGVDVSSQLVERLAGRVTGALPAILRTSRRAERFLRELAPAALLLADEYHRQDWLAAAARAGIPTVAIQHGIIHDGHGGYIYGSRPASMTLPTRTYVFGRWERDLLVERSCYRAQEVVVSGSPRLSLVKAGAAADRAAVRAELGIAEGDRLLVVSGTWGPLDRAFAYPVALAAIMDRPLPGVHIVVKLHPAETDEGPYRAVLEGVAAARGILAPPITIVQKVDLYRILAASDAHLGIHSTVMTEAVAAGSLNLLAAMVAGADQLDYVAAGVAVPVHNGADVLDALTRREELLPDEATRRAFADAHFEPGDASARIADDLRAWLG